VDHYQGEDNDVIEHVLNTLTAVKNKQNYNLE
jgi:hypothetical protein